MVRSFSTFAGLIIIWPPNVVPGGGPEQTNPGHRHPVPLPVRAVRATRAEGPSESPLRDAWSVLAVITEAHKI
jgi:hypothetical protein